MTNLEANGVQLCPELRECICKTGNEAKLLLETRVFEVLTDLKYFESDKYLRRGRYLVERMKPYSCCS